MCYKWRQTISALASFLLLLPCFVTGFAPASNSNPVLDAISKMKSTMNKNQQSTMDLLNEINAGVKGLMAANTAQAVQKKPPPVVLDKPPPTRKEEPVTLRQIQPDTFDTLGPRTQRRAEQLPKQQPKARKDVKEPKIVAIKPDNPLDGCLPQQPMQHAKQPNAPSSSEIVGLVALPPDQPFMNSGQQLQWQEQKQFHSQNQMQHPASSPPITVGLLPDQPFQNRNSQTQQGQQQAPPSRQARVSPKVNLRGLQPDYPFGHLMQQPQQQHQSRMLSQPKPQEGSARTKDPNLVPLQPDQIL